MYTKKQILLAIIISLVIIILCIVGILFAFFSYTTPVSPTPTPQQISIPGPSATEDVLKTYAATMVGGNGQAAQFSANVQNVIDTSAIPCLVALLIVAGIIFYFEFRSRRRERGEGGKK
jgi:ABC-type antimicrobial peptide transport system permease subunit